MNFKTILFFCTLLPALAFQSYAQEKTTLDIRLKGLKKGEAIYILQQGGSTPVTDTLIALRDNRVTGTVNVPYTCDGFLFYLPTGKSIKDLDFSDIKAICLSPGDKLKISGGLELLPKATVNGGLYDNPRYAEYFKALDSFAAQSQILRDSVKNYTRGTAGQTSDPSQIKKNSEKAGELHKKINGIQNDVYKYMADFIHRYPADPFSAYVLNGIKGSYKGQYEEELYNLLSPQVRDTPNGKVAGGRLQMSKAWEKANKNIKADSEAPDFTLTDIEGRKISLSDLRGKYVVLDFWGSWCGPCRNANPHMVKLYDRYKDYPNFAMISLALDRDDAAWRKAVKEDGLTWTQVNMCEIPESPASVNVLYGVSSYPTQMLVSPEGKILVRQNGFNPQKDAVSTKLEELFGQEK